MDIAYLHSNSLLPSPNKPRIFSQSYLKCVHNLQIVVSGATAGVEKTVLSVYTLEPTLSTYIHISHRYR